jgi:hypothetical protein
MRILIFLFSSFFLLAQPETLPVASPPLAGGKQARFAGVPFVQNYSKGHYKAGNQNWAVACGPEGFMYFANNEALLVFDGQHWQSYFMPGKIIVRGLAADDKGRVYTGGLAEFGYWTPDATGQLSYHSLSEQLPEEDRPRDEIWKIYASGDQVVFQSFSTIYILSDGKLTFVEAPDPFLFLFEVEGRYYVEVIAEGIFELKGGRLEKLLDKTSYGDSRVLSILPFGENDLLIGTAQNGLFIYSGGAVSPWKNDINEALKKYQLNNGLKVLGRYYVFGTILDGIYMVDFQGKLFQHINKRSGLQNNTVLSLQTDRQGNVWAGLDNGIDRIEINSPLYYYNDRSGQIGTVYTSQIFDGKLYIGTNQGLYYSPWHQGEQPGLHHALDFRLVEGSQGQVWDLRVVGRELLCGHNNGTFRVTGTRLEKISEVTGGYTLERLSNDSERLIQGTYTGLVTYRKVDGKWTFAAKVKAFEAPVKYLEEAGNNAFWTSGYQGLSLVQLNARLDSALARKSFGREQKLPESTFVNVFRLAGRVVFATDSGFHLYDAIADEFHPYAQLNERLGSFASANQIIPAGNNEYWFIRKGHLSYVRFGESGRVKIDSMHFAPLNNRMLHYYENVDRLSAGMSLISLDDGFAIYSRPDSTTRTPLIAPQIRRVEDISDSTAMLHAFLGEETLGIPYRRNHIRISYALPHYSANEIEFQYFLEGISRAWSDWSPVSSKEFTHLPAGEYIFKVRARSVGGRVSPVGTLRFEIFAPWYQQPWMWPLYLLLVLLMGLAIRRYHRNKLRRHREEVQQKMQLEQEERLRQEAVASEQRLMKLKNDQLENELAAKNRELANSAMNIVYKNELFNTVHDELLQLRDNEGRKLSGDQLRKISKIIEDARSDERDWNLFEESFNEAHENFFLKLKANYPELVPNDLKLCAYLRMNMSSKEIASLLNITTRGVEIRRYRLRKKLNLKPSQNLTEFLISL